VSLSQRREKMIARLRVTKTRAREGAVLVEGVRAVSEALDACSSVSFAVASPKLETAEAGKALSARLAGLDLVRLEDGALDALSDTESAQGVLLVCREPAWGLGAIRPGGRYLVLDGVQDPGNAGTLVRAAVAFGLDAVVFLDGTVDPWAPKSVRASAGMVFRLPIVRASADEAVARLNQVDVALWVADAEGEDVDEHPVMKSFALVVGNEGRGVRPSVVASAVGTLAVSMPGGAESLNVAMAGSVLLHALTRAHAHG